MKEELYQWVRNMAVFYILFTAILNLVPDKKYEKYVRFFMGLLLIFMMSTPIFSLFGKGQELTGNFQVYLSRENKAKEEKELENLQKAYLEKGYETELGQGGTNVSGGQKQRLSIARAIAKHPKIYLFDDSFSALDYKTDVALRRALKAETGDATVIIVAQRISTVLHANQILVLEDGRIVGKGTHAQLMESCPAYQEIARSQLSNKELNLKGGEA